MGNLTVFVFYDPPHLLKNVRNNLCKCNIEVDGKVISWQHIVDFYNLDKSQPIQMAPKLKEKHINLPPFASMRVNLAAQVLSHSVAAGLASMVTFKQLPESATDTAEFVEHFDALFNTFNSCTLRSSQRLRHAFNDSSGHHSFLRDILRYLERIKTKDGKELPCIYGWKLSINALLGLWQVLKTEEAFQFLLTSRLNQDCAENLFSVIHKKGGFRDNPDAQQFKDAFKYVVASKLFVQSTSSNCLVDGEKILLDVSNVAMARYDKPIQSNVEKPQDMDISLVMKPPLSIGTQNVVVYMAGYLLRKIPVDDCSDCSNELKQVLCTQANESNKYEFVKNKALKEVGSLIYPSPAMAGFVEKLENVFNGIIEHIIYMPSILTRLCVSAKEHCTFLTCQNKACADRVKDMVKLYMKVRIFHALEKSNEQNTRDKSVKRNRKMLKLSHL